MSTFTDERAEKLAKNLANPATRPPELLSRDLIAAGVDAAKVSTEQTRSALDFRGRAIDTMSLGTVGLLEQRSRLSFITDALGPRGENILTESGIKIIRALEAGKAEFDKFRLDFDRMEKLTQNYEQLRSKATSGLNAFEQIVGIVETRKLEGGGELLKFDVSDPRDARIAGIFADYVDQWIDSEMGDPKLRGLNPDELLEACSNFPAADRRAFDLSHPDRVGEVSGLSLGYSISSEFDELSVVTLTGSDGKPFLIKGIDPGPTEHFASGPLDR